MHFLHVLLKGVYAISRLLGWCTIENISKRQGGLL